MAISDSYKHQRLRKQLVEHLRMKGINDEQVLTAIEKVPRHLFMDDAFLIHAYEDKPFPIGSGQTISQPYTVAFQTHLLGLKKGEKVLEVGTGSGYQSSILLEMGAKVFTIERQKVLYDRTKLLLLQLGYSPKFFYGDGYKGLPTFAPFDKVLVTAGAPYIPESLKEQLIIGGILVIPVGAGETQTMVKIKRISENEYLKEECGEFRFVPLLEDKAW